MDLLGTLRLHKVCCRCSCFLPLIIYVELIQRTYFTLVEPSGARITASMPATLLAVCNICSRF